MLLHFSFLFITFCEIITSTNDQFNIKSRFVYKKIIKRYSSDLGWIIKGSKVKVAISFITDNRNKYFFTFCLFDHWQWLSICLLASIFKKLYNFLRKTWNLFPGLKAFTREHGLTEYWANRITFCDADPDYPKVFCWIYR